VSETTVRVLFLNLALVFHRFTSKVLLTVLQERKRVF